MEDHDHANVDDHHQTDESNVDPAYQVSGIHIRYELAVNDHVVGVGEDQGFVQQLKLIVNRKSKWFNLANHDELISKSFQGSQGRAYLFNSVVNIGCGQAEERVLLTGLHAVADIYCDCCKTVLGWKYEQAYESSQKYNYRLVQL